MLTQRYVQNIENPRLKKQIMICLQKKCHHNTTTSQFYEWLSFMGKKHAVTIGCFGHMLIDVKSAELALVPCSNYII